MEYWVVLLLWLIPSIIVASVARRRGFSFWAYLLHCYLPSPFIALITLRAAIRGSRLNEPLPQS
jgi:hypothetical protein